MFYNETFLHLIHLELDQDNYLK